MQKYKPKKPLAAASDKLLRAAFACTAGIAWFVYLWGFSLAALCAGVALGGLMWLCVRQFGKQATARRETQMRRIIGGELALEQLLMLPAREAGLQAAVWIAPKYSFKPEQALGWGVTGEIRGQPVLVRLIAQHKSLSIHAQQLVEVMREMHACSAARCIVCATAPLNRDAVVYANDLQPTLVLVNRDELIHLAGFHAPATDDQLRMIGRKKKTHRTRQEWAAVILAPERARRYLCYGMGLGLMAVLTKLPYYPLPSAICLVLAGLCKWRSFKRAARTF